jgi:predicted O-methyltransferase YrrM
MMSAVAQQEWAAVDRYLTELLVAPDAALDRALDAGSAAGLPPHNVSPSQGKLLELLARVCGACTILELGTLGGYSTIWLARALPPDGRLITVEADAHHAEVARANIERAGLAGVVELRVGPALETLPRLADEGYGPFDLIFLDADKSENAAYLEWSLKLSRPGTLIVADNVVRGGAVADAGSDDPRVLGVQRFFELLVSDARVTATAIQTVGSKGYDGFVFALVLSPVVVVAVVPVCVRCAGAGQSTSFFSSRQFVAVIFPLERARATLITSLDTRTR